MSRLFVMDLDGTVVHSMSVLRSIAVRLFQEHYHMPEPKALEQYKRTEGQPFVDQLRLIAPDDPNNDIVATQFQARHKDLAPGFPLAPGLDHAMARAKHEGHKLALVSSTYQDVIQDMAQVRALPWDFIGGFASGAPKAVQIRAAAVDTGKLMGETTYFGDSSVEDHRVAQQVGCTYVWATAPVLAAILEGECDAALPNA